MDTHTITINYTEENKTKLTSRETIKGVTDIEHQGDILFYKKGDDHSGFINLRAVKAIEVSPEK